MILQWWFLNVFFLEMGFHDSLSSRKTITVVLLWGMCDNPHRCKRRRRRRDHVTTARPLATTSKHINLKSHRWRRRRRLHRQGCQIGCQNWLKIKCMIKWKKIKNIFANHFEKQIFSSLFFNISDLVTLLKRVKALSCAEGLHRRGSDELELPLRLLLWFTKILKKKIKNDFFSFRDFCDLQWIFRYFFFFPQPQILP